jgi:outer membrane protein assembly factor BamB
MSRRRTLIAFLVALAAPCSSAETLRADWPQWRGPNRDGISTEAGLLKSWPEGGPHRVWLYENAGVGYGGPAVVGGRLFLLGTRDDNEVLVAIDANTGEEQWTATVGEIYRNDWGDGARSTPAVDRDLVFALGGQGNLVCVRAGSGDVVWTKSMKDFGGEIPNWGYAESPFVYKNTVLCTPGGEQGSIAAFSKQSGELVWQSKQITSGAHYASIVPMKHAGHEDAVQLLPDQFVGFDPDDGKLLWSVPWPKPVAAIPTPVVKGNFAYCTSAYGTGCKLVEVNADHEANEVYFNKEMKNKTGGVVLVGDHIFGHSDGVGWVCQNFKSGEQVWHDRDAMEMGSVTFADGMLYCQDESSGEVALVEASTDGWKEHGRFRLEPQSDIRSDRGKIWTHPVISDGRLYLRDQNYVYCYNVSDEGLASARSRAN